MSKQWEQSLYLRIQERCKNQTHLFLDLDLQGPTKQVPLEGSEMLDIAERIGAELSRQAPNHLILINLDHCVTFIPVFWGCLAAGLICMPLQIAATNGRPSQSDIEQLKNLMAYAPAIAIVYDETTAEITKRFTQIKNIRRLPLSSLLRQSSTTLAHPQAWKEIAYLIQTSGTTGSWKYAAFSGDWHRFESSNSRRVLSLFPLSSSTGVTYAYALNELSAYLPLHQGMRNPDLILQAIEGHEIQTLVMPPVMVTRLLQYFRAGDGKLEYRNLKSLTKINIGSSSISAINAKKLSDYLIGCGAKQPLIFFSYGLTETGGVAYGPMSSVSQHQHQSGLRIGPIVDGTEVRILKTDEEDSGEIAVRRPFTFLGYLDPSKWELNRFNSGIDWFKTGDLGLIDNGQLILSGRCKDIISINSRKISLESVERHIYAHFFEFVEEVIACAGPEEELILFYYSNTEQAPKIPSSTLQRIKTQLHEQFNLVLREMIQIKRDRVPRTATGKIKKHVLVFDWLRQGGRQLIGTDKARKAEARSASTSIIDVLHKEMLRNTVATPSGEPDQLLIEYELDSLSLAQVIGSVERQTGYRCNFDALPDRPTLQNLADLFETSNTERTKISAYSLPESQGLYHYPQRKVLSRHIQATSLLSGGQIIGSDRVVRRFNSQAKDTPIVFIGSISIEDILLLKDTLKNHPLYIIRLPGAYRDTGSNQHLASICVDWIESAIPKCRPILIGHCISGIVVRHIAVQLWNRPCRPRMMMLMDWNPGSEDPINPYLGRVLYHIHEWHWGQDLECKSRLIQSVTAQTPRFALYFAESRSKPVASYMDFNQTIEIISKIVSDPRYVDIVD